MFLQPQLCRSRQAGIYQLFHVKILVSTLPFFVGKYRVVVTFLFGANRVAIATK